ncbi:MAG TPA: peptidylprolyl isomerase [Allosphingosinicella sp.]|nr:peptidylprolyl isomerase [Allosphingosinicella sp.]
MLKRLLLGLLLALAGPALAQTPAATAPAGPLPRVALVTDKGRIVLELDIVRAPITARNFLRYVDNRRYDRQEIYRAMPGGEGRGLIQGGVRDGRLLFPPIAHEPTSQTGLSHVSGAISVPRRTPGTAQAEFTIMIGDLVYLDAGPESGSGDGLGYAVFGRVVEGMDVVRAIFASPVSPTEGEGHMRGQMLQPRVRIISARRLPPTR